MESKQTINKIRALVHGCTHTNVVGATVFELVQALQNPLNVDENNVSNVLLIAILDKAQALADGALTPLQVRDFFVEVATSIAGTFDAEEELELAGSISRAGAQLSHIAIH